MYIYLHLPFTIFVEWQIVCNIILYAQPFFTLSPKPGWIDVDVCLRHPHTNSLAYHLNAALLIINSLNYLEISNERKCNGRGTNIKGENTKFVLAWMNDSVFVVWRTKISFQLVKTNKMTQKILVKTICLYFGLRSVCFGKLPLISLAIVCMYSSAFVVVIVNNCPMSTEPVLYSLIEWNYTNFMHGCQN